MNRRNFIQTASAALAGIPLLRKVFARTESMPFIPERQTTVYGKNPDFRRGVDSFEALATVKVTGVWKRLGIEAPPRDCEVNESGYIELPQILGPAGHPDYIETDVAYVSIYTPPDAYRIYVPLKGFDRAVALGPNFIRSAPCYFLRQVNYRDAKRARFTIPVEYQNADLVCQLAPGEYERLKGES